MASTVQTVSQMASDTHQSVKTAKAKTVKTKVSKKVMTSHQITSQITTSTATTKSTVTNNTMEIVEDTNTSLDIKQNNNFSTVPDLKLKNDDVEISTPSTPSDDDTTKLKSEKKKSSTSLLTGKKKSKKIKKSEAEKENISVTQTEKKMRILSNNLQKSKTIEHSTTESDDLQGCSDNSCDKLKQTKLDEINKEIDYTFTSIKDNPFILNFHTKCAADKEKDKDASGCINNQSVTNPSSLQQNSNPTVLATKRDSRLKSPSRQNSTLTETLHGFYGKSHEDVLANIDVKHLKTVYLPAEVPSQPCKTQNRSIIKANKQGRSIAIKNLCRSFGDLSFISDGDAATYNNFLKRTKSVGDLEKFNSLLKYFKYYGVSVRVLRNCYTNLIALEASEMGWFNGGNVNKKHEKSSFSKFDTLQKRNLIHVRSSDAGKAQEKFTEPNGEKNQNCRVCQKQVYKMEEIKAEKSIYHKNCFRCNECEKQLKVDNYQSHEGVLYCKAHFKLLFSPKVVEGTAQDKPRKPELIIRENQPMELPPDVVRASDKPDLGLEELQQINIRAKFAAFENSQVENNDKTLERTPSSAGVKRSASILSKLAKFQAKGFNTGVSEIDLNGIPHEELTDSDQASSEDDEDADPDLVRAKRAQRERPVGLDNMNDIKTKFESGHLMTKEERREERKQEIQNIRSRLFMGKQARIKEMYQQAVAESEHGKTSVGKVSDIEIGDKARSLKEKFEKGEIFKEHNETDKAADEDLEVFASAISKKSRSLFKELDASIAKNQMPPRVHKDSSTRSIDEHTETNIQPTENVIKHDEKIDDVHIETSDISSKFKFFETYKPAENEKKTFRITPPREGVVKLPTPESESDSEETKQAPDTESAEKTHTATIMLNKFREMEQSRNKVDLGPRPLKCFTPPPDESRRVYNESDSDMENMSEEGEYEEEGEEDEGDDEYNEIHVDARSADHLEDEALKQAQAAARAKQLRAKFEKWEANEIQREIQEGTINLYGDNADENQIESARSIREKFENMKETQMNQSMRPRYKVNRFV